MYKYKNLRKWVFQIRKHLKETDDLIKDLQTVGEIYGFITKLEHRLLKSGYISADLAWRVSESADPVVIIEVESTKNPNMVQNAMKIFGSRVTEVKKPWFFFHIVYRGDAGEYGTSLSYLKEYLMYHLFENIVLEENRHNFVIEIHKCVLCLRELTFEEIWERFKKFANSIRDTTIQSALQQQIIHSLNLPKEVVTMIDKGELTPDQGRKLEEIRIIMNVSPDNYINKMIGVLAQECSRNRWSLEEIGQILDNMKYSYIIDRFKMYEMNLEHDQNIKATGTCFCMDLRRKELKMLGHSDDKIEEIFKITEPWGREDHIHVLCTRDPNSANFQLYYRVMFFWGIHHSDLKKLEPTVDELVWAIKQSNKWRTVDKGLCWNCGENPYEVEINGFLYCKKCAHEIIEERADRS